MTTIKHAGVPVAVVPTESTPLMEDDAWREGGDAIPARVYRSMLDAAPSEPGADLVELIGALEALEREHSASVGITHGDPTRDQTIRRARAALAKWGVSDAG